MRIHIIVWEDKFNEHANGLIWQFYTKSTNFKTGKQGDFQKITNLIKHRPRKFLDYRAPHKVLFEMSELVALQI